MKRNKIIHTAVIMSFFILSLFLLISNSPAADCKYSEDASITEYFSEGRYSPSKEYLAFVYYYDKISPLVDGIDTYTSTIPPEKEEYLSSCPPEKVVKHIFALYTLNLKTKVLTKIADIDGSPQGFPFNAYISWVSNSIAYWPYTQDAKFSYIVSANGGPKQILCSGEMPELSPDGKEVAYIKDNNLWMLKGKAKRLIKRIGNLVFVRWEDKNSLLLYTFNPETGDVVYRLNLTTLRINRTENEYLLSWGLIPPDEVQEMIGDIKITD